MKLGQIIFLVIVTAILFGLDVYVFKGAKLLMQSLSEGTRKITSISYWVVSGFIIVSLLLMSFYFRELRVNNPQLLVAIFGVFFTLFLTKVSFAVFHLIDDVWFVGKFAFSKWFSSQPVDPDGTAVTRGRFLTQIGLGIGAVMFSSVLYGFTWGKYAYRVVREKLSFDNLPQGFDGVRIVQISDAHLGSFLENFQPVEKAVQMINDLKPDYVFFTGDLVNSTATEALPWIDVMKKIEAKNGKYSIMGNHDYADYSEMNPEEKKQDIALLHDIHEKMGFHLLLNECVDLEMNGDQIALIGMENWGKGFSKYGDFAKAKAGSEKHDFKLMLSHDPSHWEQEIMGKEDIDITFAGHTHGMQMGVEIPSLHIKFSPARIQYKRWGGLYQEAKNFLYVNRGFGFLGMPGRIGMPPEITLLELKSRNLS